MKNDPAFNIEFVQLIEKYPVLYDYTFPTYANKSETDKTWAEIAEILEEPIPECISKWRILRSGLNRDLRTRNTSINAQDKKSYYLSPYMKFVLPFLKSRKKDGDINVKIKSIVKNELSEGPSGVTFEESLDQFSENSKGAKNILKTRRSKRVGKQVRGFQKIKFHESGRNIESCESAFKKCVTDIKNILNEERNEHEDLLFLKSLLPDIALLNKTRKYQFKMKVLCLLQELLADNALTISGSETSNEDTYIRMHSSDVGNKHQNNSEMTLPVLQFNG